MTEAVRAELDYLYLGRTLPGQPTRGSHLQPVSSGYVGRGEQENLLTPRDIIVKFD